MIDYILNIDIISIQVFLLSMLPITEQRLTIPYYILNQDINLSNFQIVFISILGNITIGIVVYLVIAPIFNKIFHSLENSKSKFKIIFLLRKIFLSIHNKIEKSSSKINQKKMLGLLLFIGIPLPFTGVWTGAFAASVLKIDRRYAITSIILGVLLSAIIVTTLTLLANELWLEFIQSNINRWF